MRSEYFEYNGLDDNPFVRKYVLANENYFDLIGYCKRKNVKLNVIIRVIYLDSMVRVVGHVFDISLDAPKIIEAFTEEMPESEFERMHEYYLFGLNSVEMEAY